MSRRRIDASRLLYAALVAFLGAVLVLAHAPVPVLTADAPSAGRCCADAGVDADDGEAPCCPEGCACACCAAFKAAPPEGAPTVEGVPGPVVEGLARLERARAPSSVFRPPRAA